MSAEDLERYEAEVELQLYKEYKDVVSMFTHVVETERRFYLANDVKLETRTQDGRTWFELELRDAWVWDMYRPARFVQHVRVVTFKDVNIEELARPDRWDDAVKDLEAVTPDAPPSMEAPTPDPATPDPVTPDPVTPDPSTPGPAAPE